MEYIVIILGILLLAVAVAGVFLPGLPGPPLAYGSLLLILGNPLASSKMSWTIYMVFAVVVVLITILDYYLPIWGTTKFGGTQAGAKGSLVGLVLGIVASPFSLATSLVVGPFIGAVVGELVAGESSSTALKSGIGSFVGFATGAIMKTLVILSIAAYFIYLVIPNI